MNNDRLYPEQIDHILNWPLGMAARLARQRKLPHIRLPDGSVRFNRVEVEALIVRVDVDRTAESEAAK